MVSRGSELVAAISEAEATGQWSKALELIRTDLVEPLEVGLEAARIKTDLAESALRDIAYGDYADLRSRNLARQALDDLLGRTREQPKVGWWTLARRNFPGRVKL